jgi:outer membrane protein OmpA-like peptidoglycan-associated protein
VIRAIPFALAVILLAGAVAPAAAQTVVGSDRTPSVTVDEGVIDSLGPPPTLPELLRNGQAPERRAVTAPPRRRTATVHPRARKKVVAKAKPKPKVAGHPAAPVAPVAEARGALVDTTTPAAPRPSVTTKPLDQPAAAPQAPSTPATPPPAAPAAPAAPNPSAASSAAAAAPPTTPTVAPPSPVPTAAPSPAAVAAMDTPASMPRTPPVAPTPVTPAAAPADIGAAANLPTRVLFPGSDADLPNDAKPALTALAQRLKDNDQLRLILIAHASGTADQANEARRISLQRALAVRTYLMEAGVASTRMDVRALGNRVEGNAGGTLDRVDIQVLDH